MLRVGVSNIYVRRPGHLLCHIIVPELDHPEEDLGAALGHLATVCLKISGVPWDLHPTMFLPLGNYPNPALTPDRFAHSNYKITQMQHGQL